MFPIADLIERFEDILSELDALSGRAGGDAGETLEDLNAEFEDELLSLSEIRPGTVDAQDELCSALEDLHALAGDYRALSGEIPELGALAVRLAEVSQKAASDH